MVKILLQDQNFVKIIGKIDYITSFCGKARKVLSISFQIDPLQIEQKKKLSL